MGYGDMVMYGAWRYGNVWRWCIVVWMYGVWRCGCMGYGDVDVWGMEMW